MPCSFCFYFYFCNKVSGISKQKQNICRVWGQIHNFPVFRSQQITQRTFENIYICYVMMTLPSYPSLTLNVFFFRENAENVGFSGREAYLISHLLDNALFLLGWSNECIYLYNHQYLATLLMKMSNILLNSLEH